jgi:hypothetical protein
MQQTNIDSDILTCPETQETVAEIFKLGSPNGHQTGAGSTPPLIVSRLFTVGFCTAGCARPVIKEAHRFVPAPTGVSFVT